MRKLIFQSTQLSIRGTEVALFDYARYNEELLGNQSLILYDETSPLNDPAVIRRFEERFPVHAYRKGESLDKAVAPLGADLLYFIKLDRKNYVLSQLIPTMVHEVFPVKPDMFHGSAYAFVSGWLSRSFSNSRVPTVPHIVSLPDTDASLRQELGIPADATVFGCHGGKECFDIPFVKRVLQELVNERRDIYFLFLNVASFAKHERIVFLEGTSDVLRKTAFINSCDAMLHGRRRGETFGLACAEFSIRNKPVFTYALSGERNHIEVLGDKGLLYRGPRQLRELLSGFDREQAAALDWDCYSQAFSAAAVMRQFDQHFIRTAAANGVGDTVGFQLGLADHLAILGNRARIRGIKMARGWSSNFS